MSDLAARLLRRELLEEHMMPPVFVDHERVCAGEPSWRWDDRAVLHVGG